MIVDPQRFLSKRIQARSFLLMAFMIVYITFSFFIYFQWVAPSLDGRVDRYIAADSPTYIDAADALREGLPNIYLDMALTTFPNTGLCIVLLAYVLQSTFAMALACYAMFFLALFLLKRSYSFSLGIFMGLLLLNGTTTISLLSINKEIIDLLTVSIFFFARKKNSTGVLIFALVLAAFNRFEVCAVMITFLFVESRFNPWCRKRGLTLVALILALSILLPLVPSETLTQGLRLASNAHLYLLLDTLQMHYLFAIAVIPKILLTAFGALIAHPFDPKTYFDSSDIANSLIIYSNNLATAVVFTILLWKRKLTLKSDFVYFAILGFIMLAPSMVNQARYVYFAYALLCLQAAQATDIEPARTISVHMSGGTVCEASLTDHQRATL
jgi:hypothetical protein